MPTWEFPCSEPIDANISLASGSVTVTAAPTNLVTVSVSEGRSGRPDGDDAEVIVEFADRHLVISEPARHGLSWRGKDLHITASVPAGSRAAVQAASADVACRGTYSATDIRTASGRVKVDTVTGPAEISTMSGRAQIADAGEPTVETASGGISIRHARGDVSARTASGAIRVGVADGSVTARTASGDVRVLRITRGRADVNSVSGDVEILVAPGTGVFLDLASVTGRVTSDLTASEQDAGADLHLQCRTVSGSLRVARSDTPGWPAEAETMKQGS